MIDRQKLETVLDRRFPGATSMQIAAAANAIMDLEAEWEETAATMRRDALVRGSSRRAAARGGPGRMTGMRPVSE
jgi:hypothetical protein